jgi:antitoxin HicB
MRYAYPLELDEAPDGVTVTCPDIPELITEGASRNEAISQAKDALITALSVYVDDSRPLPTPTAAQGRPLIAPNVLEAAKFALHDFMLQNGISNVQLAQKLNTDEKFIRRLRDPLHRSHIGAVEDALHTLGQHVELVVL